MAVLGDPPFAIYQGSASSDTTDAGPRVVSTSPALDQGPLLPLSSLDVTFSEPIDLATFQPDDLGLLSTHSLAPTTVGGYGGSFNSTFAVGSVLYTGTASGLRILDVSNPASVTELGRYGSTGVVGVQVVGSVAYLAEGAAGLEIVDVSNPAHVTRLGRYVSDDEITDVEVVGNKAYLAEYYTGLAILDISNPAQVSLFGGYEIGGWTSDVQVVGNRAYLTSLELGLQIFDISDPAHVTQLGGHYPSDFFTNASYIVGNVAYVADSTTGLLVFDISNPAGLTMLGQYSDIAYATALTVVNDRAYVINGGEGLRILDISNPSQIVSLGGYGTGTANDVQIAGSVAYVAGGNTGLTILDVSNPANTTRMGGCDTAADAYALQLVGNTAYIADGTMGLAIVDVGNPAGATRLGAYTTANVAQAVQVVGPVAYVAEGSAGLEILNVSNPSSVTRLGGYDTTGAARDVRVVGSRAYVADNWGGLQILDISNPGAPVRLGGYASSMTAYAVHVVGSRAYIAGSTGGLRILDVSNPANVIALGAYSTGGDARDVQVVGNRAYVATGSTGLQILDISNPTAISRLGGTDTPGFAYAVHVLGSLAYVADGSTGLQVLDVSDPAHVVTLAGADTPGYAQAVQAAGNLAYVADGSAGMQILRLAPSATGVSVVSGSTYRITFDAPVQGGTFALQLGPEILDLAGTAMDQDADGIPREPTDDLFLAQFRVFGTVSLSSTTVAEEQAAPTVVGTLSVVDPDATSTFSYALVAGAGDNDSGLFTLVGDQLQATVSFDYETRSSYSIRVRATNDQGQWQERAFTIGVLDVGPQVVSIAPALDQGPLVPLSYLDVTFHEPIDPATLQADDVGLLNLDVLAPSRIGGPAGNFNTAVAIGSILYAGTGSGLEILDISNPAQVTRLGGFGTTSSVSGLEIAGTLAYVAASDAGLKILDVSNPAQVTLLGEYRTTDWAVDVEVVGDRAYLTTSMSEVLILDVSSPANVIRLGGFNGNEPWDIDVVGSVAYVTSGLVGLQIFDISAPAHVTQLGGYYEAGYGGNVQVVGNLVYSANYWGGLQILDVSNPAAVTYLGGYGAAYGARDVQVVGNLAYVADGSAGLEILDVHDPANVSRLGGYDTTGTAQDVKVVGNLAYVADGSAGLQIIRLAPPVASLSAISSSTCRIALGPTIQGGNYALQIGPEILDLSGLAMDQDGDGTPRELSEDMYTAQFRVYGPPTNVYLSPASVAEKQSPPTLVGSFSSVDPDAADTFSYTLATGAGDTDNAAFSIANSQLLTNVAFDYETKSSYSIRVRSTDREGLWLEQGFTVTVTDVNEAPTNITLAGQSVPENSPSETLVGNLSTTDPEGGSFTYALVDSAGGRFKIVGSQVLVDNGTLLDFEVAGTHAITVRSTDSGGLSVTQTLTIALISVSEAAPTEILLPFASVLEQQPPGTPVGLFTSRDPDCYDTFAYSLVPGTGSTDNASFTVDSLGNLRTAVSFDYGTKSSCSVRVRSTDEGGLWTEKAFTVSVTSLAGARVDMVSNALLGITGDRYSDGPSLSDDGRYIAFSSYASNLIAGDSNNANDIFVTNLSSGVTNRVSTDGTGSQSNGNSSSSSLSGDGRYVAFLSSATNLVPGDTNGVADVFVKDLSTGAITRVSTDSAGTQGNGTCSSPSISSDGRYVAFASLSTNLVARATNGKVQIFLKDRTTGVTTLMSADASGNPGAYDSGTPVFSGNGHYLAFRSAASNLVTGDSNNSDDIYVRDLATGTIIIASTTSAGGLVYGTSDSPCLSGDGRYVAFRSIANGLIPGDTNGVRDIFVKDLATGEVRRVSTDSAGTQGNNESFTPCLSRDGRSVAFSSEASNLVGSDTNASQDVFVKDLVTGTTTRVSTGSAAGQANGNSTNVCLSADGRYPAFVSSADNLTAGDTNGASDIFVKDMITGTTRLATARSPDVPSSQPGNGDTGSASVSGDGRYVAFGTYASNMIAGDANGYSDIFVRDFSMGTIALVSTDSAGNPANGNCFAPSLSSDGRYVAFQSTATNLVANDTNSSSDIFVKDLITGITTRVSTESTGAQRMGECSSPSISGDGRYVAFAWSSPGPISLNTYILVKDRTTGTLTTASSDSAGIAGAAWSIDPHIDSTGRYVAFHSLASNLVPGDTNNREDVFLKDLTTGTTTLISTSSVGAQGDYNSSTPSISADGRYVAFRSGATNLVPGDTNGTWDVFVKDVITGTTTRISTDSAGAQANNTAGVEHISGDGRYVMFYSLASNLVAGDTNGTSDVFVKDLVTGTTRRMSTDRDGNQGNGSSTAAALSRDGRYLVLSSNATNLHPWDTTTTTDLYRIANPTPPTDLTLNASSIAEDQLSGTLVGGLASVAPFTSTSFTYALVSGAGSSDNSAFFLDASGNLRTVGAFDYEYRNSYTIRARTTDQRGLWFEKNFTITVTDVNEAPTDITMTGQMVLENSPTNALVGILATADPEGGSVTYSLLDSAGGRFKIVGSQLLVDNGTLLNAGASHTVAVRTTDSGGLSFDKSLSISVINSLPPRVVSTTPSLDQGTAMPLSSIDVTFSQPIDPATFQPSDVALLNVGSVTPSYVGGITLSLPVNDASSVLIQSTLYAASGGTFQILDVSDPAHLRSLGGWTSSDIIEDLQVVGNRAYVACFLAGLQIYDVSDPARIVWLGQYQASGSAYDVQVVGNRAYVATDYSGLVILDISNPASVTRLGGFDTPGAASGVQVVGNVAYVADYSAGIQILDVSNPASVTQLGGYDTPGNAVSVQVVGNLAYVADTSAGLQILDISNPAGVTRLGGYSTFGSALDVQVTGSLAYIGGSLVGMQILDVSNPAAVTKVGGYATTYFVSDVNVVGNLAYLSDTFAGLHIVQLAPSIPSISWVNDTTCRLSLGQTIHGDFAVQLGPEIQDLAGRAMDQDGDGLSREPGDDIYAARFHVYATPTHVSLSSASVKEEQPAPTLVGAFSTVDNDPGDTFSYRLVAGAGDTDNVVFTVSGNELRANITFDYETQSSYSIRVRSADSEGLWCEQVLTIAVVNVGPRVVSTSPDLTGGTTLPLNSLDVTFSEPLDLATFQPNDVGLLSVGSLAPTVLGGYGGAFYATVTVGATLYAGTARGLQVYDISNPAQAIQLGGSVTTGAVYGLQVVGSRVYVAADTAGLLVFDVSNPANVTLLGGYDTSGNARGVRVAGNVAYVADGSPGLQILDISDPGSIIRLGGYNTSGYAYGVDLAGSTAYIADASSGLQILNVSNPASVVRLGGYDTPGNALAVQVAGSTAYIADGSSGLQILNVSAPASVTLLGGYATADFTRAVQVVNGRAYVADGASGLQILDVSNPASVTRLGGYDTPDNAWSVQVTGSLAYVSDENAGLQILDVSNPASVALLGGHKATASVVGLHVVGNTTYLADGAAGLKILDTSNPASVTALGGYTTTASVEDLQVVGQLAYVADGANGLQVLDVSNPANVIQVGGYNTSGTAYDVQVVGDTAYVAEGFGGLEIFDISHPGSIIRLGRYNTTGSAYGMQVVGDIVYIADGSAGLQILDVSNPAGVTRLGGYDTPGNAWSVQVIDNVAYVCDDSAGLQILDVADPLNVIRLGGYSTTGATHDLQIVNGLAYLSNGWSGLLILDVTNPANVARLAERETAGFVGDLQAVGNLLYVTDDPGGLQIIQLAPPVASISWVGGTTYRITPSQPIQGGNFVLQLGPGIQDLGGAGLDQDRDGIQQEPLDDLYAARFFVYAPPTNLSLSSASVAESQPAPTVVGSFSATDPDAGETFSYTLVTGAGDTDNNAFSVAGNQLDANVSFDYETKNTYSIRVRVTDNEGLWQEQVFTIAVLNVGPRVVSVTPALDQGPVLPLNSIDVTFSEPLDLATFQPSDAGLLKLGSLAPSLAGGCGGAVNVAVTVGSLVYAGTVGGVEIFDVSDPTHVTRLGGYRTAVQVRGLQVVGSVVYAAVDSLGLEILNVANPGAVTRLGGYDTTGYAYGVQVVGNVAYVADASAGVQILNVSNPASVVRLGGYDTTGYAYGVQVIGNVVYVADASAGLQILDVSNPAGVVRLGGYDTPGFAVALQVVGSTALVADGLSGLQILDVSNPAAVTLLGGYDTPGYAEDVQVVGNIAYVADEAAGLQVLEISAPASVVRLGGYDTPGYAYGVHVVGGTAYVADYAAGLQILEVSVPASPTRLGGLAQTVSVYGHQVVGDTAYIADGSAGLKILNISNPAQVTMLGGYDTPGTAEDVQVVGHLAYVVDGYRGLHVLDVSDPANVTRVGGYDTAGYAYDVQIVGNRAYIADGSAGLKILDITNPANVTALGGYDTTGTAYEVQVVGNKAYIADNTAGLQILDISDPASVIRLGGYDTPAWAFGVQVVDNVAYVVDFSSGLQILDVSDPANVLRLGGYDTPGDCHGLQLVANLAYVADGWGGLQILDVRNPANVVRLGGCETGGYAGDLQVVGNTVYIADDPGGFEIVQLAPTVASISWVGGTTYRITPSQPIQGGNFVLQVGPEIQDPGGAGLDQDGDGMQYEPVDDLYAARFYAYGPPTSVRLSATSIAEDQPASTTVGIFMVTDPDATDTFEYCLVTGSGADDNALFAIFGNQLRANVAFDYETRSSYSVRVRATDSEGLWREQTFTITVLDVGPRVVSVSPVLDQGPVMPLSSIDVTFREPIDPATFQAADVGLLNLGNITPAVLGEFGGAFYATVTVGSRLYAGTGSGLQIFDVSNPAGLIRLGGYQTPEACRGLQVVGNQAYLVDGNSGLLILDISNPAAVELLGWYDTSSLAYGVQVVGGLVYVADYTSGLEILDIADPANIVRRGGYDTTGYANSVQVAGNVAYVADDAAGLQILDISDPANIVRLGGYDTPGNALSVHVVGSVAYVADRSSGLQILDVSNPAGVVLLGGYDTPGLAYGVQVVGGWAYVADDSAGLQILDVSTPATVTRLGGYDTPGNADALQVPGNVAYVADGIGGLQILDIADPANVTRTGGYETIGAANRIRLVGDRAYVADGSAGLKVLDVNDPTGMVWLGGYDTPGSTRDVQIVGNIAYVADGSAGLQILDISNPAGIIRLGGYDTTGYAYGVHVVGHVAYVADGSAGVQILDISNPATVTRLGGYDTTGTAYVVQVVGSLAYVADDLSGLQILDVSTPAAVLRLGGYDTPSYARDVQVVGHLAYVADYASGLQILDVTDPANVTRLGGYDTPILAFGVQVVGTLAYVADYTTLQIVDVSNPASATPLGSYRTAGSAVGLHVAGGAVYLAESAGGMQVIQVASPVAGVSWVGGNTYRIALGQTIQGGDFALQLGPEISDLRGVAMDQDGDGLPGESGCDLFLACFHVYGPPTDITLSGQTVPENSAVDTVVGDLSTVDPDGGSFTYTLLDSAGGRFKIVGGQVLVDNGGLLDYETATSHDIVVRSTDSLGWSVEKTLTINVSPVAVVQGRYVFYNNSAYDGNDPAANASDDNAIALDKTALLPGGTASFANYTSYVRGINGIIVDIGHLSAQLTAADFEFRTGNDNNPSAWALATAPTISIRWGEGALLPDGVTHADRVTLIWNDYYVLQAGVWVLNPNGIGQKWLQVTVKATANTGLNQDDVFYFGSAIGESGDSATSAAVNILDFGGTRDNPHNAFNRATITDAYDFDRDQFVNIVDLGLVRDNGTNAFNDLNLITVPASPASAMLLDRATTSSSAVAGVGEVDEGSVVQRAALSSGPQIPLLASDDAAFGTLWDETPAARDMTADRQAPATSARDAALGRVSSWYDAASDLFDSEASTPQVGKRPALKRLASAGVRGG